MQDSNKHALSKSEYLQYLSIRNYRFRCKSSGYIAKGSHPDRYGRTGNRACWSIRMFVSFTKFIEIA